MEDVADRLESIRERVEAATDEACPCCGGAFYWKGPAESAVAKPGDVPYLLSLVEDIGKAMAEMPPKEVDALLDLTEMRCSEEHAETLAQVRDAALKKEYEEEVEG